MKPIFVAALMLATVAPAQAVFHDGNELHALCEKGDGQRYVMGIADAMAHVRNLAIPASRMCPHPDVQAKQMYDVACKALRENPQDRHLTAASIVWTALAKAFPCE